MAPTSVLEPMVLLYRLTGEPRYLEFCQYILRAWEQPNGPKIISTLLTAKRVDKVGNGKAYEMLSCLNGALEYYRTVGDAQDSRSLPQRLAGHRRQPPLHHRRRQLRRAFPRRLRPAQRRQCGRDVRHRHLAAVQRPVAATDRRSAVCRATGARGAEPVVRRPAVRRLRPGAITCRWKARSPTAPTWTAIAASPAGPAASR